MSPNGYAVPTRDRVRARRAARGKAMIKEPEFYRVEAERVRRKASTAPTQELRDQWQKLAAVYERLAVAAEDVARGD